MKQSMLFVFGLVIALSIITAGCTSKELSVDAKWVRPAAKGANSAIFFTIENPTNQDVALVRVNTTVAEHAELHRSEMDENGVMKMEHQDKVLVPAGGRTIFEPGGYHVMLIGLKQDLLVGDNIMVTLIFDNGEQLELDVPVKEQ